MQTGFLNTRFLVLAIGLIITVASIGAAVTHISYNSSFPRSPNGVNQGFICTTVDEVLFNATVTGLNNAIWYLNGTGGTVHAGVDMTLSDSVKLSENLANVTIDFHDATITMSVDKPFINVTGSDYCTVKNVNVYVSNSYTSPIIYLYSPTGKGTVDHNTFTKIQSFDVYNQDGSYPGIKLHTTGLTHIWDNTFSDCYFENVSEGIYLDNDHVSGWMNHNHFEDMVFDGYIFGIKMDDEGTARFNRNKFIDFEMQTKAFSTNCYNVTGHGNYFYGCGVSDIAAASSFDKIWEFDYCGNYTTIVSSYIPYVYVEDNGGGNSFWGYYSGDESMINIDNINPNGVQNLDFFTATTGNPNIKIYGYKTGIGAKYFNINVANDGDTYLSAQEAFYLTSGEFRLGLQWNGNLPVQLFGGCGSGENAQLQVFGRNSGNTATKSINTSWGDGTNDFGFITAAGGVSVQVLQYDQNDEPDIPTDTVACWKDADGGPAYFFIWDIDGTQVKVGMT